MSKTKPKAVLKDGVSAGTDCFVPSCNMAVKDKCEGIPFSNRCAACRCKKNYMGVDG